MAKTRYSWEDASTNSGYYVGSANNIPGKMDPWTRATVADGKWLNQSTIKPFSGRDEYLLNVANDIYSAKQAILTEDNAGIGIKITTGENSSDVSIAVDPYDTYNIGYVSANNKIGFQLSANISAHIISADNSTDSTISGFNLINSTDGKFTNITADNISSTNVKFTSAEFDSAYVKDLSATNLTVDNLSAYYTSAYIITGISGISASTDMGVDSYIKGFDTIQGENGNYTNLSASNLTATTAKITNISGDNQSSTVDNIIAAEKVVESNSGAWDTKFTFYLAGDTVPTHDTETSAIKYSITRDDSPWGAYTLSLSSKQVNRIPEAGESVPDYKTAKVTLIPSEVPSGYIIKIGDTISSFSSIPAEATESYYAYMIKAGGSVFNPSAGDVALGNASARTGSFAWSPLYKANTRYSSIADNGSIALKGTSATYGGIAIKGSTASYGGMAIHESSATNGSIALYTSTADRGSMAIHSSSAIYGGIAIKGSTATNGGFAITHSYAYDGSVAFSFATASAYSLSFGSYTTVNENSLGFAGATVSGSSLGFGGSTVNNYSLGFAGSTVNNYSLGFAGATVSSQSLGFAGATVSGSSLGFGGGIVKNSSLGFGGSTVSSSSLGFAGAIATDTSLGFGYGVSAVNSSLGFAGAKANSNSLSFGGATANDTSFSFAGANANDCSIGFGGGKSNNYSISFGGSSADTYSIGFNSSTAVDNSIAMNHSIATDNSIALGKGLSANTSAIALGYYNLTANIPKINGKNPILVIGNGTSDTTRSNACMIYPDGTISAKSISTLTVSDNGSGIVSISM